MKLHSIIFFVCLVCLSCNNEKIKTEGIQNDLVQEESNEEREERKTNEKIKTQEINESQPSIEIEFTETELYVGQSAKLEVALYKNGAIYPSSSSDFSYRATYGAFQNDTYTAPVKQGLDTITIKYIPTDTEKAVNVPIIPSPKLEVSVNPVLSCSDNVKIVPQVYIGDNVQSYPLSTFVYSAKHGLFTGATYRCPEYETNDTISIRYPALNLTKDINVAVKAKPVLTVDKVPTSIEKDGTIKIDTFMKKAQNREDIAMADLSFSAQTGSFQANTYTAQKIGRDKITVTHKPTGQKVEKNIEVKDSLKLKIDVPKYKLENFATMLVQASILRSGSVVDSDAENFSFVAEKGTFKGNEYKAPEVRKGSSVFDMITISHKESQLKQEAKIKVIYSEFTTLETDYFSMPVPSKWRINTIDMGFVATSYEGKFKVDYGSEIKALALSGFDFLDPQTVMVLFQQQGGIGKHMQKIGEDPIEIAGEKVTRMIFESDSQTQRKSWWIIFKKDQVLYLITLSGDNSLFGENGRNSQANHIINSFKFKKETNVNPSLQMSKQMSKVDKPFFEMELPSTWKFDDFFGIFFAMSGVSYQGEKVGSFLFAHRSREIQSMDLSLILILFRQEIVKDPKMEIGEEQEIEISGIRGKMIEFSGGQGVPKRMWLIALKHNYTGYVMVINGPKKVWDANPNFAEKIKNSFRPK